MKSYAYAAVVAAISVSVEAVATAGQCATRCPAAVTQANPQGSTPATPLANSGGFQGCPTIVDAVYGQIGNANLNGGAASGIFVQPAATNTDALCLAACQGITGCAGYLFNTNAIAAPNPVVAATTCYIFNQQGGNIVQTAIQNTPAGAGTNDVEFFCPAVSSSSVAPVASSSVAVVASSAVVATSAAAGASSVPVGASSVVAGASSVVSSAAAAASSGSAVISTAGPSCPASSGQIFSASTPAGVSAFNIVCGAGTVGKRGLPLAIAKRQITGVNAFGLCITACANVASCQSVLFNPVNGACALFNCIIPVPAGLSGATRVTTAGGQPFIGQACPAQIPTTIPPQAGANGTANAAPVFNLNLNIDIEVNVLAGEYKGVPYTQICKGKCDPCDVCTKKPVNNCSVCQQKDKPSPLKPSTSYCPPGQPGKPGFPGTCTECEAEKTKPVPATAKPGKDTTVYPSGSGSDYSKPSKSYGGDYSNPTGKYTGPYSNDAAGLSAVSALVGGVAAAAFALL